MAVDFDLVTAAEATGEADLLPATAAFSTGDFAAKVFFTTDVGVNLDATVIFFGATGLPVNVFETRAAVVFFAGMGAGFTFITKKSLLRRQWVLSPGVKFTESTPRKQREFSRESSRTANSF